MAEREVEPVSIGIALVVGAMLGAYYQSTAATQPAGQTLAPPISLAAAEAHVATESITAPAGSFVLLPTLAEPLPLVFSETLVEDEIQQYLHSGAVVLPLGTSFGEPGNVVITAHSSGTEAFGPYRFAFSQLAKLQEGDEYDITTPTARYRYRVYATEIVWPHEVDRLPQDDRSTVTLVTCWPLWTNFQRLLVHTELVHIEYNV